MPFQSFRPLEDHAVGALGDEEVLDYLRRARTAGDHAAATRALQILVFGYLPVVRVRVARRVPAERVEDVAAAAVLRAVAAALRPDAFGGEAVGQFRRWLHTIVDRQVVDFWRARERAPEEFGLPEERAEGEQGSAPVGVVGDEAGAVQVRMVVDEALDELQPTHRAAVELYVLSGCSAAETASAVGDGMTENNVHKIAERFRTRLRILLGEGGG